MNTYVTAYTRDYVQPDFKPKLYKPSNILKKSDFCNRKKIEEAPYIPVKHTLESPKKNIRTPYSYSPTNCCVNLQKDDTKSDKKCLETSSQSNIEEKICRECVEKVSSLEEIVKTTYREHFTSPDEKIEEEKLKVEKEDLCSDEKYYKYTRLKKKAKLAIWEMDDKMKHQKQRKNKDQSEIEQNRPLPAWKSEYDDVYNRTANVIIRANKIRIFRRQKALKTKH